ncbi:MULTISPECIES: serine hydrolase domain-containing protein [unclassified Arthrobacter]|uniref:serine hydrolase domain-containing protein n=1 Tax=unclassified Arthrobacter TaxID=235627 RepID=UPI001D13DC23|nr:MULTISPECIES: serine hydrolase domain-containing protein [unclassified Arthrobacter]MCC3275414.1 beta-lactamase family protein [Arthrobacter sp. zg-Y20]MCC9176860.1 beta-lactamase family protein [Arthrobacter sp. zg-Y750]MDK1315573.1 serine hydrolase domain-containing protein [Arthrobacter sp. zg.Y20]WIB05988.1 serine hydrolase domain-containing protein [Arthrobacter sp. zg-Y20]
MPGIGAPLWDKLSETVESGWCPGLVAGIRLNGQTEIFATGSLGVGRSAPMGEDTPFRISSLSKLLGGALALSLLADGTLELDEDVSRMFPVLGHLRVLATPDAPLSVSVPARGPITLRHLLTFTAGFGIDFAPTPYAAATRDLLWGPNPPDLTHEEYLARLAALPLAHQPGDLWMYHSCADLLSVVMAKAADSSVGQLLQERVNGPFGLTGTGFPTGKDTFPTVYEAVDGQLKEAVSYRDAMAAPPIFESLAGGLVSTVPDYLRFLAQLADDAVLPASLRQQMTDDQLTSPQRTGMIEMSGPDESWGFMTAVQTGPGAPWSEPGMWGWAGGSGTSAAVYPNGDAGVVFTQRFMSGPQDSFDYFWEPFGALRASVCR